MPPQFRREIRHTSISASCHTLNYSGGFDWHPIKKEKKKSKQGHSRQTYRMFFLLSNACIVRTSSSGSLSTRNHFSPSFQEYTISRPSLTEKEYRDFEGIYLSPISIEIYRNLVRISEQKTSRSLDF